MGHSSVAGRSMIREMARCLRPINGALRAHFSEGLICFEQDFALNAESVKYWSPGQGTASLRAVTPPWVGFPRNPAVERKGWISHSSISRPQLRPVCHRILHRHGHFVWNRCVWVMTMVDHLVTGEWMPCIFAGNNLRAGTKLRARRLGFGLGKPKSLATSPARPNFWIGFQPRAARPFAALPSACPRLWSLTPAA